VAATDGSLLGFQFPLSDLPHSQHCRLLLNHQDHSRFVKGVVTRAAPHPLLQSLGTPCLLVGCKSGDTLQRGVHQSSVMQELFDAVQNVLSGRSRTAQPRMSAHPEFPFASSCAVWQVWKGTDVWNHQQARVAKFTVSRRFGVGQQSFLNHQNQTIMNDWDQLFQSLGNNGSDPHSFFAKFGVPDGI
jgi:hypothetical protein